MTQIFDSESDLKFLATYLAITDLSLIPLEIPYPKLSPVWIFSQIAQWQMKTHPPSSNVQNRMMELYR